MTLRRVVIETLSAVAVLIGLVLLWSMAASAQVCGTERTVGAVRVQVICPDWPAMRKIAGSVFPDEKGQQVLVRSSDPSTRAFRVSMTYRKDGQTDTVVKYTDVHETYDSGVGWVLGDIDIIGIDVTELRETAKVSLP